MRKEHAEHNEKACELLYNDGNFDDWVITTAFYSAIHFVRHKLFPLKRYDPHNSQERTFNNFNEYISKFMDPSSSNRHKELRKLVTEELGPISGRYRWLSDNCWHSRYHNYKVSRQKAKRAREHLKEIKQACV